MMPDHVEITAVIINFRTPDLTRRAVETFRAYYPTAKLLLIDNGSHDQSAEQLREFAAQNPDTTQVLLNESNRHHGPAMDQALRLVRTPYVLFLDSDCTVLRGGFVEAMHDLVAAAPEHYAAGKLIWMNSRGFDVRESPGAIPYIRPLCILIKRALYLSLPPFERHGAPCLTNMTTARARGLRLLHFPVEEFVHHQGRGTAARHGYRLGWRGKVNHLLNRLGF